jgi:hypothetical protein
MSDFKQIGQIIEGHFNKAISKVGMLKEDTEKLSNLRMADCLLCDVTPRPDNKNAVGPGLREQKYCKNCGCDMEAKTKVIDAKCPIGRW